MKVLSKQPGSGGVHCLILLALLLIALPVMAQYGTIQGTVMANDSGEPLVGANVVLVNTSLGSATDSEGRFEIQQVPPGQYTVKAIFIGYHNMIQEVRLNAGETVTVNFELEPSTVMGEEIVVSASRRVEKLTEAPATIMVVNADEIARTTAFTYGEALVKAKGVDIYRTGIDGVGINARGFMTAYSYRMQLMADGKNAMLPGAGLAAGNMLPVPKEDIARIETILGPASALYGPNAHNGLVNVVTKHPRDYPGTTIAFGGGQNSIMTGRLRHARAVNEKLAYKVNVEYLKGQNWTRNDTVGYDNNGKAYLENPDHGILNFRTLAALYYNITPEVELMLEGGYSVTNSIGTTNVGRNQLLGWKYDYETIRISSPRFFIQFYRTGNDAGRTHAIGNKVAALIAAANAGVSMTEDEAIDRVKYIDKSKRYDFEGQYNTDIAGFRLIVGFNYEDSRPVSNGTYLSDTTGNEIKIRQAGIYGQVERELGERWKLVLAGRYDTHDRYKSQFSPRAAVVFKVPGYGNLRVTYNRAFQAPAILQQDLYLGFGALPGGIPVRLRGNGHGFTLSDGTVIDPLEPEVNETFEIGYKGLITKNVFIDVNAYRSKYQNFISPLTAITSFADPSNPVFPVKQGDVAIPFEYVLTYRNFGRVNINGLELGVSYQIDPRVNVWFNYSYINPVDLEDPQNDFNKDGKFDELSFNTPKNKFNVGASFANLVGRGTYLSIAVRRVDEYDFISGRHRATKAGKGTGSLNFKDEGPLGGFTTVDIGFSYQFNPKAQLNISATNIFDTPLREMVASPATRRLITAEVRYQLP